MGIKVRSASYPHLKIEMWGTRLARTALSTGWFKNTNCKIYQIRNLIFGYYHSTQNVGKSLDLISSLTGHKEQCQLS